MIKRKTPQKHMSTASTEKMLDSSATDTNIAVIVASRPPPRRRPPQHRGGPRRPHTCTHNTHTTTRSHTTSTVSSSSSSPTSFPLSCQLSTVNLLALSRRPALFSEALRERAVVDTSASTTRDDDGDDDDDDDMTTMATTTLASTYAIGAADGSLPAERRRVAFSGIVVEIEREGCVITCTRAERVDASRTARRTRRD